MTDRSLAAQTTPPQSAATAAARRSLRSSGDASGALVNTVTASRVGAANPALLAPSPSPFTEMARTHPAEYQTLTRQPGFIAYRLTKPSTADARTDDE
nr:hypothetical protein [Nocardia cyriacigeorgica]